MTSFVQELPASRVVFGPHSLDRVPEEVRRLACRAVLLVAGGSQRQAADELAGALGPLLAGRIGAVVQHVPEADADRAARLAGEAGADGLVCLGGGSATGLAKAVALRVPLPIVAVPTTYAGSELTPVWGITAGGRKRTGRDPAVQPRTVVYDPLLTLSLPPAVTAASGMNAAAHCVEALYAPEGQGAGPLTSWAAEEGLRALAAALPRCVEAPGELDARGRALYGAWLAGLALGGAATGVHHKTCHVLGGTFGLPHAETHAALLPHAAAFNAAAAPAAMARVARALGAGDAAGGLWDLAARTGAPTSLRSLGLRAEDVEAAAELVAAAAPPNPRPVDAAGVAAMLRAAWSGRRPEPPGQAGPAATPAAAAGAAASTRRTP
ncbi:MAG TPA: iron-containing alcohol dehydrogenase [Actinomycetes bacterium]|jgi:maleylacetate reductase|nr:iron-containing alcohol dehydrogenase [Actinomycetes bacterium]